MSSWGYSHLALGACLFGLTHAALYNSVINTTDGPVYGYPAFNSSPQADLTNWKDISVWKGIPFAATTGGSNRWKPPQPVTGWNATLYASDFGNVCPSETMNSNYTVDEDCLNLNIWSAANSSSAKLPVVMWSYPAESAARDALFDGGGMADKGVVFVNYNYRTGSFGWLALPELSEEREESLGFNSSGNYGMLDQFAALKWIKANIAAFGGDPDHITVMGQSAGSAATYHILNSPLTQGLIVGAIIESGVRDPHDPLSTSLAEGYVTLDSALEMGTNYTSSLNATTLAELRALPMDTLITQFMGEWSFSATLDGYAMPATYLDTLVHGSANDVPIITGNTKDESGANYNQNVSLSTYLTSLNTTFGSFSTQFYEAYGSATDNDTASAAYNAQWTDRSKIGTWLWTRLWATASVNPVYSYYWDHAPPGQDRGAYHESEINYVLNNLYGTDLPWTDEDYEIATTMNDYWVRFIKTGNPNGGNLTAWEPTNDTALVQRVGDGFESIPVASSEEQVSLFEKWLATQPAY